MLSAHRRLALASGLGLTLLISVVYALAAQERTAAESRFTESPQTQIIKYDLRHYRYKGDDAATVSVDDLARTVEEGGNWQLARRFQMTGVDGQSAMAQMGSEAPLVTGSSSFGGGRVQQNVTYRQVGTLVRLSGRASAEGVVVQLEYECSEQVPQTLREGDEVPLSSVRTLTVQATVLATPEAPVAIELAGSPDSGERHIILLSAAQGNQRLPASASATRRATSSAERPRPQDPPRPEPATPESRYNAYAQRVIEKYDINLDGVLNADELKNVALFSTQQLSTDDVDKNQDGSISAEELAAALLARLDR